MQLVPPTSRQASADDVEATNAARAEIERMHADMTQLSTEKVRLAGIAMVGALHSC
jgi:hypothetical protein